MDHPDTHIAVDPREVQGWLDDPAAHRHELEEFLRESPRPPVLLAMSASTRMEWAELCVQVIRALDHRLEDLLRWRAEELGDHPLFETLAQYGSGRGAWTYRAVVERTRWLAAAIWSATSCQPQTPICLNHAGSHSHKTMYWCSMVAMAPCSNTTSRTVLGAANSSARAYS